MYLQVLPFYRDNLSANYRTADSDHWKKEGIKRLTLVFPVYRLPGTCFNDKKHQLIVNDL